MLLPLQLPGPDPIAVRRITLQDNILEIRIVMRPMQYLYQLSGLVNNFVVFCRPECPIQLRW